jgi:hypothetical protein
VKHVSEITEDDKAEFLDLLRDGLDPGSAAHAIGTTGTQMRKMRRSHSVWFDSEFADACAVAEASPEATLTKRERLEEAFWLAVEKGEKWAIEKGLYAYHPDFEHLRHTNLRVSGEIMVAARALLPHLTDNEIEQRIAEIEAKEADVIEIKPRAELPTAG